jgi:hypothetical protein
VGRQDALRHHAVVVAAVPVRVQVDAAQRRRGRLPPARVNSTRRPSWP